MGMKKNLLIFTFFCLISVLAKAQISTDFTKVETHNGQKFYMHEIAQGQTLYALSKAYNVSVDDIIKHNPSAQYGLNIGQILKIPYTKPSKKEEDKKKDVTDAFVIHTIEKGETLFSLSKKYNVLIDDIKSINGGLPEGLKLGESIKIPAKTESTKKTIMANTPAGEERYITHQVLKGETLFSLAKKYDVNMDSIRIVNGGFPEGIKEGQVVRIPKLLSQVDDELESGTELMVDVEPMLFDTGTFFIDEAIKKDKYNIAFMLPLFIKENDSIHVNKKSYDSDYIYPKSKIALEFYKGATIAFDSLSTDSFNANIYLIDSGDDEERVIEALKHKDMTYMNLIIGPFYRSTIEPVIEYSKRRKINMVCPVPQHNKILLGNAHVSKVSSSASIQMEELAKYVVNLHHKDNIVLVNPHKLRDEPLYNIFKRTAELTANRKGYMFPNDTLTPLSIYTVSLDAIKKSLKENRKNIIILPCSEQDFVTDFITTCARLSGDYEIVLYGIERWMYFENIDVNYLHKLNVHIPSGEFIDFENEGIKKFTQLYMEKYGISPGKYAILGFDISMYYLGMLAEYGNAFPSMYSANRKEFLAYGFDLFRTGIESGYENRFTYILKYEDYRLKRVK
jgi:LysM repeat protein